MQSGYAGYTDAERRFWLRWVVATIIGFIIGGAGSGAVVLSGEIRFADVGSSIMPAVIMAVTEALAFAVQGAAVGTAQWIVLRQSIA